MKLILQTFLITLLLTLSGKGYSQCSSLTTLNQNSGTFDDGSGSTSYNNNSSCTWLIQPTSNGVITLNFNSFSTESGYDYLRIYDGNSTSATLLGTYSGTSLPPSITSSGNSLFLRFTTDGSQTRAGWNVTYSSCSFSKPTISSSSTTLCNQNILFATVANSGFTYQWVKDDTPIAGATSNTYSTNSIGDYKVSKTDGTCTSYSDEVKITSSLANYTISATNTTVCNGTSTRLSVPNSSLYSYQWNINGTDISGATSSFYNAIVSGDYSVTYTRTSTGCSNQTTPVTIQVLPTPTKPILSVSGNLELCNSSIPPIITSNVQGGVWNNNETTQSILASQAGNYYVTVTNGTCSVNSDTIIVTDNSPSAAIGLDYTQVCQGGTLQLTAPSPVNIFDDFSSSNTSLWSINTGTYTSSCQSSGRLFFESSTSVRQVVTNTLDLSSGANVSLSMEGGQCEALSSGEEIVLQISSNNGITWTDLLVFPITTTTADYSYTIPANAINSNAKLRVYQRTHDGSNYDTWSIDNFAISVNNSNNSYSYAWSPAASLSSTTSQSTIATITAPTVIGLTVTDQTTGCISSSVKAVQVNDDYISVDLSSNVSSICEGETVNFTGTPTAPSNANLSYSWNSNGEVIDVNSTTTTGTLLTTQPVTLTLTDLNTGCHTSDVASISVSQMPNTPQISSTGSLCNSSSVTFNADNSYNWSNGQSGSSITVSTPGSYYAINTSGQCVTYSDTIQIIDESPQAAINLANNNICPGGKVDIEGVILDGFTTLSDDFSSSNTSNWSINTGTYTSSCQSSGRLFFESSTSIRQVVTNTLDLSAGAEISLSMEGGQCEALSSGEEIVLQISSNNGLSWTDLLVFPILTQTADYTYSIPANIANSNAKIRVYQRTHDGSSYDTWSIDNFTIASNISTTSGNYTYAWSPLNLVNSSNTATTQTTTLNTSSTVNLTVTDVNTGCSSTITKVIPVDANHGLGENFSISSPTNSVCPGGSIDLTISKSGNSTSISDDFSSPSTSNWSLNKGSYTRSCSSLPSGAIYFSGASDRQLVSNTLDLSLGAVISFDFEISACDAAESGEFVELQISTDNVISWVQLQRLDISLRTESRIVHTLPANQANNSAKLRWVQLENTGSSYDTWYIDDVNIDINTNTDVGNSNYSYNWTPTL